jgi:hypothetical protein
MSYIKKETKANNTQNILQNCRIIKQYNVGLKTNLETNGTELNAKK